MGVNKNTDRRIRIKKGIRNKISGTGERPRLSVYRSNKGIYAQIIDDTKGSTIAQASPKDVDAGLSGMEGSKSVGKIVAERAVEKGINSIVFDRSGYKYHGKIKALAEGAREGGLKF